MAFESRNFSATRIHTFFFSFLCIFFTGHGTETDINCLRSIKESLEDPNHYLSSSWDFNNISEGSICIFNGVRCWDTENRVMTLEMSNFGLKGQFPRGIQNCSSLLSLDLSGNDLSGPLPSDISKLVLFIGSLDLSNNKFSGEIPASLADCSYLGTLQLDHNRLSGQIPPAIGLLNRLMAFTVANNYLSGPVPSFRDYLFPADSYANNTGLCGGPLAPCEPVISNISFYESFKEGAIIGFSSSVTSVVVIYLSYCVPWAQIVKKNRRKKMNRRRKMNQKKANKIREPVALKLLEKQRQEISKLDRFSSRISFMELYNATACFSIDNEIGMGNMGMMYKAWQPNGELLAVKRLYDPKVFKSQFFQEIKIIGRLRHKNIIPLLGFCIEGEERILAYQYMSNGRLSDWLKPSKSAAMRLEWPTRVRIALGIARGLSWLHRSMFTVHRSVTSQCVLLDENFEPKLSNFGKAKIINQNNYIGPGMSFAIEDEINYEIGFEKKDVYNFGIVLFELITGRQLNRTTVLPCDPSDVHYVTDKTLIGKGYEEEIHTLLSVACDCIQCFPVQRPTMLEIYNKMSNMWERHEMNADSETSMQTEVISVLSGADEIVELET